ILLGPYLIAALVILLLWTKPLFASDTLTIAGLVVWCLAFASARRYRTDRDKKPLVFTARLRRHLATSAVLALALVSGGSIAALSATPLEPAWYLLGWLAADMLAPRTVAFAGSLMRPVEVSIQNGFKRQARERMQRQKNTTVIGITGSYGKTSVKFAIAEVLRRQFNVLETPASYNTPMGICKVINNDLEEWHRFLVLEMGARYRGDIRELCAIATPDVAVLTSVGLAHLETMGSEEAILETKGELIDCMKRGGPVVVNGDDAKVMTLASRAAGPVTVVSTERTDVDLFATDIRYDTTGCHFRVADAGGEEAEMHSLLLGRHNVINILLALAVGRLFGMTLRQMKHAVGGLKPVPHRLNLRKEGQITVIDDAFNSNPVGARNAVDILSRFDSGQRVIVTPGMIELGERQEAENRALGAFMVDRVDMAILVGRKQTESIREGLVSAGFDESRIRVVDSLFEAQAVLKEVLRAGDVVLYENDLPDHYDERS
ncbi:MAG TPA: UDP-N-acetylmuramoyl-tripeptide--D-alanyl-D-alanine ligase, partial [Rhodothermia bacterium]|nr:UDP-N-acetylmuramoyl-tripeptide--D-alanyl-D-alanine ligase [Rhodothermia bacterium]